MSVFFIYTGFISILLSDIQDLYEDTLLNERKSITQKAIETRRIAERWELHPPFGHVTKIAPLASVVLL